MSTDHLSKYTRLIRDFIGQRTTAQQFESAFLGMFKSEDVAFDQPVFEILNDLFTDVDAFCGDPALRNVDDLDEDQLREACKNALDKFGQLGIDS